MCKFQEHIPVCPLITRKLQQNSVAQLAANGTPCEISKSSATLQCSWGLPSRLGRPDVQDEKTSGDTCTASPPGQGKISGPRAQHQRLPAAASEKTVAAHQAAPQAGAGAPATNGLAMLSKALEDLCSPAIAAPVMGYSNGIM